jgi:hypothetical protein
MRKLLFVTLLAGCSNNEPQYVACAPMGTAAPTDLCSLMGGEVDAAGEPIPAVGSLHVPVMPEADWKAEDRNRRMALQMAVDATGAVTVPIYRLEHYDLSVEWRATNNTAVPGTFRVDLDGANEEIAYDPAAIMVADDEDPPAPPLAGDIPIDIGPNASIEGVFREDQLREAAIDLDQITRGNVNPFAATLTTSKTATSFQPVTPYDPVTETGGAPDGPEVPAAAFRQLVRVDIRFRPDRDMVLEYTLRIREHIEVIHEEGLNAPAGELDLRDPPVYAASLP